jgi:hypothetical protein
MEPPEVADKLRGLSQLVESAAACREWIEPINPAAGDFIAWAIDRLADELDAVGKGTAG